MARKVSRGPRGGRSSKATSKKTATSEVEIVEEADSGIESTAIMVTTIVLVVACLMMDRLSGMYGDGVFF